MVEISSDHRRMYPVPVGTLWEHLGRTGEFRTWWPWLREFDGGEVRVGAEWSCRVRAPLLYPLRFRVCLEVVEPRRRVQARVAGDIAGRAEMRLADAPGGSVVRLTSVLAPSARWLRTVSWAAAPLLRHGHDRVMAAGLEQLGGDALVAASDSSRGPWLPMG